ncbi:FimV C-terminal domain-containing protein [Succinivibrio dextrinosolvens]|uniref:FimV/HubP family polar landmark protein n=1 Tax=Succinivibrio dextrinosolvens TaxID=83771 RepID=UPI0008EFF6ED|nr:FimV/HubP family polar landmark protein [Succinivibrio dextrinosolvens]SFS45062.1 FimV C-terminal domain-containing protein [Succinivibrio dextrinosolvens]
MHRLKKVTLEVTMGLFISLSAIAADDDGTFTITIQGPEVEETVPASRPVRTTPRRSTVTPQQAPAVTVAPRQSAQASQRAVAVPAQSPAQTSVSSDQFRTYNVVSGDTIWSVAHRYAQLNRSINEFQVVASIYRNNPQAFGGGNVNNLLKTTLRIPSGDVIAQESTQTGSALLAQGVMSLPPLPVSQPAVSPAPQGAAPAQLPQQSYANVPPQQTAAPANANKPAADIPVYTATETRIKEVQKQREAEENGELIPSGITNKDSQNPNERRNLAENGAQLQVENGAATTETGVNAPAQGQVQGLTPEQLRQIQALLKKNPQESVDVKSIRIMLEENKKQIDQKTKVIEQQLADAIARMKKSSAVTAQTAADSVSSLSSQYDNIIAGIQQDLIEIKGNVSKLSQDNDRMREMLLANDEKIEDMQLQMSQFTVSSVDASIDMEKPVMMILFGAGLLSVVVLILFIIFKARARARSRKYHDDFDFDDSGSLGSDDMLLSDDNGSIELETPSPDVAGDEPPADDAAAAAEGGADAAAPAEAAPAAQGDAAPADTAGAEAATDTAESSEDSQAQAEWDKAAEESADTSSNDQNVLDEWSKALNEDQSGEKETEVEGKSDDASVADEWAAALGEQEKSEKAQEAPAEEPKKDEQEDMAAAWAAALGEQECGAEEAKPAQEAAPAEEKAGSDEQEDMAAAWAAALGEQEGGAETAPEEPKAEASSAESTQAEELKKSMNAAKAEPEKSASAPKAEAPTEETGAEEVNVDDIAAEAPAEEAVAEDVNVEDIAAEAPAEEAVAEDINVDDIAAEAPAEEAVAEDVNVEDIAAEASAEEAVAEDINVDDIAAEAPAEEAVAEDVNVEDIAAETPAEEAVAEDVNVEDIAAEAPDEEAVTEDVNVGEIAAEAPSEEAVTEDINVEDIAEQAPVEESVTEEVNVDDIAAEAPAEEASQDPAEQEIDVGELVQNDGDEAAAPAEEISGEESALLDAMANQESVPEVVQADVVDTETPAEGSGKVDEVVDDEIDLEVLLRPVEPEGTDDLVQNEPAEEAVDTQNEDVVPESTGDENLVQEDASAQESAEVGETEITAEAAETPVEEPVAEESAETSASTQDEVVSWEVPQDEYDVVSESSQNDSVEDAAADLAQLEARIGSAGHYMDPQAESDLMNMLGDGVSQNETDLVQNEETAFSPEEISRMINGDSSQAEVPDLQKVSNTIGPISASADLTDQATLAENMSEGEKEILTPKEHQYYVDELNLARLYFETGDTEEAIKIIEDVQEHGSLDLKKEASKVMEAYGS